MIICKACGEKFQTQEEHDAHWKYILDTPIRQYNEAVREIDKKLLDFINKRKEDATLR